MHTPKQQEQVPLANATDVNAESGLTSWLQIFQRLDRDNDGYIPGRELAELMRVNTHIFRLSNKEINRLIEVADANGDNRIDWPEFVTMMCDARREPFTKMGCRIGKAFVARTDRDETLNYLLEYSCLPPPYFLLLISILQVFIYLSYCIYYNTGIHANTPVPYKLHLHYDPHHRAYIWSYFSVLLVHCGYAHLLSNVFVQLAAGLSLELVHKFYRIAPLYVLSSVTGSLLSICVTPNSALLGASCACYGLIAAHASNLFLNWSEMPYRFIRLAFILAYVAYDNGVSIYLKITGQYPANIAFYGHLGGFLSGILLGIIFLRNLRKKSYEIYAWYSAIVAYVLANIVLIVYFVSISATR